MVRAYVGLGSNMGDRAGNLREATRLLHEIPGTRVVRQSALYETEPVGPISQGWFINAVVALDTEATATDLLREAKAIEMRLGRRPSKRWGPRLIDVDLLLYGDEEIATASLVVPHPEMWNRRFVLVPLLDVLPTGPLEARARARLLDIAEGETVVEWQSGSGVPPRRVAQGPRIG